MAELTYNDGSPYFNPSFGNRPLRIVGREQELATLRSGLMAAPGSDLRAPIIIGQRSYGKTAILTEAESIASDLDFACASVAVNRSMLQNVLDGLTVSAGAQLSKRTKVDEVSVGAFGFSLGIGVERNELRVEGFQAKLGLLLDRLESKGLGACILVDEVQPNHEELRELTQAYQHFSGRGRNIALIMAGLPRCVSRTLNDKVSTFLYRAERIELAALDIDDVYLYFVQAFQEMGIAFEEGEMLRAARLTSGLPYMMQLVGRNIVLLSNGGASKVDAACVDEAARLAKEKLFRNVYMPCADSMSAADLALARAIAEEGGKAAAADLKEHLSISDETYQQTRRRNIDNGIIASGGYGIVAFAMPFFSEFLAQYE